MNSYYVMILDRRTGECLCEVYVEADNVAQAERHAMAGRNWSWYEVGDTFQAD